MPDVRFIVLTVAACLLCLVAGCKKDPATQKYTYLQSGLKYQKAGKFREAIIQFSNALQIDQNFPDAHYALGHTYMAMGDGQNGYRELERTVALTPSNIHARSELGLAALEMRAPIQRAMEQHSAIVQLAPNEADAYNLQARIDLEQGNREQARQDVERALSIAADQSSFHTTLAYILLTAQDRAVAEGKKELDTAISLDPYDASPRLMLADELQKEGDISGAVTQGLAAVSAAPFNVQARVRLIQFYLRLGDSAKAEHTLYQTVEDFHENDQVVGMLETFYVQTKQPSRAEASYAALAAKYPLSVPILVTYAQLLISENKYDQAEPIVAKLAHTNGSQPRIILLKAVLMIRSGKVDEAIALLQDAVKDSPDNLNLRFLLARTAAGKGDLSMAESSYEAVLQRDRTNLRALTGLADLATRRRDYTRLTQLADSALLVQPHFVDAYYWKGVAEVAQTHYAQAEVDFRAMLNIDAANPAAHRALGELRLRQNRTSEGVGFLERSLSEDPNSWETLNVLIRQDLRDQHIELAESRIRTLITLYPKNAGAYLLLASVELSKKDFAGARDHAKSAIELNSQDINALQIYTNAEIALKDTDGAIAIWTKWMQSHPNDARALTMLGMLEEVHGDPMKAMEYYKRAVGMDAGQALAANNLAYLMVEQGQDLHVALSLALSARKALPDSPNTADTLAWVEYHLKDYTSARSLLEDACRTDPRNASLQYHLGLTYLQLHDQPKAVMHLKSAQSAAAAGSKASQDAANALAHLS